MTRREIALGLAVALAAVAVLLTETLSLFASLTRPALLASWVLIAVAALVVAFRLRPRVRPEHPGAPRRRVDAVEGGLLAAVGGVLAVVAMTAIVGAPNNFDSMTYHLSRIAHWHHQESVDFYATAITRQIYQLPGAEYLMVQLYVLFDGDRWVNMVQWSALAGSALGVSCIAARLGAERKGQLVAALACVTLPMAVLQGSSTQNDLLTALWVVCTVVFGARLTESWRLSRVLLTGACLGLAVLTKATAALFLAPFTPAIVLAAWRRGDRRCWAALVAVPAIAVCFVAPHLLRSQELSGHPLGPMREAGGKYDYLVEAAGLRTALSGVSRNLALQAAGPSRALNDRLEGLVRSTHRALGIDPDDPRTTWHGRSFAVAAATRDEDAAGAPVHLLVLAAALAGLAFSSPRRRRLLIYAAAPVAGFVLFSTLLKWNPWHTRLHLPLWILATPLFGAALPGHGRRLTSIVLSVALPLASAGALLRQPRRPLLPPGSILQTSRAEQYFAGQPRLQSDYLEALDALVRELRCAEVGLVLGPDDYEYPLWALAGRIDGRPMRFAHVGVTNPSVRLEDPAWRPCAVLQSSWREEEPLSVGGVPFAVTRRWDHLRLLEPTPSRDRAGS